MWPTGAALQLPEQGREQHPEPTIETLSSVMVAVIRRGLRQKVRGHMAGLYANEGEHIPNCFAVSANHQGGFFFRIHGWENRLGLREFTGCTTRA